MIYVPKPYKLYHNSDISSPLLPEMLLRKLMLMVTSGVEFSFDDIMYRQVDGVAMGSPFEPSVWQTYLLVIVSLLFLSMSILRFILALLMIALCTA